MISFLIRFRSQTKVVVFLTFQLGLQLIKLLMLLFFLRVIISEISAALFDSIFYEPAFLGATAQVRPEFLNFHLSLIEGLLRVNDVAVDGITLLSKFRVQSFEIIKLSLEHCNVFILALDLFFIVLL